MPTHDMNRRKFLRVTAAASAAGFTALFLGGSSTKAGCSTSTGQDKPKPKRTVGRPFKPGHPGRPLPTHGDDGTRWICDNDHEVFFSRAAAVAHKAAHPGHHVRRYG